MYKNSYPTNSKIFKEYNLCDVMNIPQNRPEINKVLESSVYPEVKDIKIIDTINETSNEGNELSGHKLIVELYMKEKVIYNTKNRAESVHAMRFDTLKSLSVVIPKEINNKSTYDLFRSGRLEVNPYVEAVHIRKIDKRNVHRTLLLFIDIKIV